MEGPLQNARFNEVLIYFFPQLQKSPCTDHRTRKSGQYLANVNSGQNMSVPRRKRTPRIPRTAAQPLHCGPQVEQACIIGE